MDQNTTPKVIGYARISSAEQSEAGQVDELRRAGASRVVIEQASGVADRPKLEELLSGLTINDALVVTEVSRLGRSSSEILLLAEGLLKRGVRLRILNLGIDTGTPAGGLVLTMMAGLARFERELLRKRQSRGIAAARRRGKHLGRPRLLTASHAESAARRLQAGDSLAIIAAEWRVSERTVSRLVHEHYGDSHLLLRRGGKGKTKRRGEIRIEDADG